MENRWLVEPTNANAPQLQQGRIASLASRNSSAPWRAEQEQLLNWAPQTDENHRKTIGKW